MARHINIVRFKPIDGRKVAVIKAHSDLNISEWKGALSIKLVDCGEWLCGIIEWESADDLEKAMPQLISFLDGWREDLHQINSELGFTDPISGSLILESLV